MSYRIKFIIIILLFMVIQPSNIYADGLIIFIKKNVNKGQLLSINSDGTKEKVIDNDLNKFLISPDNRKLIVFSDLSDEDSIQKARIYDFEEGIFSNVELPGADWFDCCWSEDSKKIYVVREIDEKNNLVTMSKKEKGFCGRMQYAQWEIDKDYVSIINSFGKDDNLKNKEDSKKNTDNGDVIKYESPDKEYYLQWKKVLKKGEKKVNALFLINKINKDEKNIFTNETYDFPNQIGVTTLPWSSDSKNFVMTYYYGGIFRSLIWEITGHMGARSKIVIVNKDTLKWKKIANGESAYWFKDLPSSFKRQKDRKISLIEG
jgi:hypothetical protein